MVRIRGRRCICGHHKQCKGMVIAFAMFEDPRGGYVELRPSCHDPQYDFLHRMNDLRRAYLWYLAPERREVFRDHTQMVVEEEREFVALHHFHPKVVREISEAGGRSYKVPLTIKAQEVKILGLELRDEDRVYDLSGQYTEEFFFVPNYAIESAYDDLKRLSKAERSVADITADIYRKAKQAIKTKHKAEKNKARTVGSSPKKAKAARRKKKTTEASEAQGATERLSIEFNHSFIQLKTPKTAKKVSGSDHYASAASLQISDTDFLTKTYNAGKCNEVVNPLQNSATTVQHSNVLGSNRNNNTNGLAGGFTLEHFPNLSSIAHADCGSQEETALLEHETSNLRNRRISSIRDMIKQEVQEEDAVCKSRPPILQPPKENQSLRLPRDNDDNVPLSDGSPTTGNVAPTDERFKSVPFSNPQTKDASPLTPRRMSSIHNIAAKKEILGDTTKVYRGGLLRSHSDLPLIPAKARNKIRSSTTDHCEKLFECWRETPHRTKSDSTNGKWMRQQRRRKPVRAKSGGEIRRIQPRTYSLPPATRSDSGGRISSDTVLLSTPEISASKSVSGTTANMMTLRRDDRTRKAIEEFYRILGENNDDRKPATSTVNESLNRPSFTSPAREKRRDRRDGLVAMSGNSLGKLKDIAQKRTWKVPEKTKNDLNAKYATQTSLSPKQHRRIASVSGKMNSSFETKQGIGSEVAVKRIDGAKRALKHYVLGCTDGETRPRSSRSPTRDRSRTLLRPMKKGSTMQSSSPAGLTLVNDGSTHAIPYKESLSLKNMHSSCPSDFAFDISPEPHSMKSYKLQDTVPSTSSTSLPKIDQTTQSDDMTEIVVAGEWDTGVLEPILKGKPGQGCSTDHEMSFPNRAVSCLPPNFHFSYPIRRQRKRKEPDDIDWNELGFYASFPVSRKQNYDFETHEENMRVQFLFPRRLTEGKTRQGSALSAILENTEKLAIVQRCMSQVSQSSLDLEQVFADSQRPFSPLLSSSTNQNRATRDCSSSQHSLKKNSRDDHSSMKIIPEDAPKVSVFTTEQIRYVFPFFQKKKNSKSLQKNVASLGGPSFILRDFAKTRSDFPLSFRGSGPLQNGSDQTSNEARGLPSYDSISPFQDAHNRAVADNLSIDASAGNEQKVECRLKTSADITVKQDKPAAISKQQGPPCAEKLEDGRGERARTATYCMSII